MEEIILIWSFINRYQCYLVMGNRIFMIYKRSIIIISPRYKVYYNTFPHSGMPIIRFISICKVEQLK